MSTYRQPYRKPSNADELSRCEYIEEMRKVYFQPPKQYESEEKCDGFRNRYTGQASRVCEACEWFSGKMEGATNDGSGND